MGAPREAPTQPPADQSSRAALRGASRQVSRHTVHFTQQDPIGLAGGANVYGFADGDPVNFGDPFGLMACPPMCGFDGDPRNIERETQMFESRTAGDNIAMMAIMGAGVAASVGLMTVSARLMASAVAAAPIVGPSTLKLIDALQKAGPDMNARVSAVSSWLPKGQKALETTLEGGAKMLSGGAGKNARQVILNADGSTVVKAFNIGTKTYDLLTTITPKVR